MRAARRLLALVALSYSSDMANKPETFFPELNGDARDQADTWLHDYLRLVIRIHRERVDKHSSELSTPASLTNAEVLARSVRPPETPAADHI
jgi:hypothetical protein